MSNRKVTQKMSNTTEKTSSVFRPLIASSLALALGVSVGMAQSVGTDGNGPYLNMTYTGGTTHLTALKASKLTGDGTVGSPWVWDYSGWLANNGESFTLTLKEAVLKLGDSGTNTIGANGNTAVVNFTATNSTLIGNIKSIQNSSQPHWIFSGNGAYQESITIKNQAKQIDFAFVGTAFADNASGVDPSFDFTNGANVKGNIYAKRTATFTFSNTSDSTTGNTFVGLIGSAGNEGDTKVVFQDNATLKGGDDGNIIRVYALGGSTTLTTTLKGATNYIEGNIFGTDSNIGSGPIPQATLVVDTTAQTTEIVGKMLGELNSKLTLDLKGGTTTMTGNLETNSKGYSDGVTQNIVKISNAANFNLYGNMISQNGAKSTNYILGLGSGNVAIGQSDKSNKISLSYDGGGSGMQAYITDYDSTGAVGFNQNANNTSSGLLTLNLNTINFENVSGSYDSSVGQKVFIDWNSGNAVIDSGSDVQSIRYANDSGAYRGGNTMVLRFRDSASGNSSITLGNSTDMNGNVSANASAGRALIQAKTVDIYGDVSSLNYAQTYVWGNAITVHGGDISSDKGKTVIVADGSGAVIKADRVSVDHGGKVYFMINQNANISSIAGINGTDKTSFSIVGGNGSSGAGVYITDYDSLNSDGFIQDTKSINALTADATFNLDSNSIYFNNNDSSKVGQSFVLDYAKGHAVINSGTEESQSVGQGGQGNTFIIRFRNDADSYITLGEDSLNNGSLVANGSKAETLFQANAITLHGGVSNGGKMELLGTESVVIHGGVSTSGATALFQAKTIAIDEDMITSNGAATLEGISDAKDNIITAKTIQSLGGYGANATTNIDLSKGGELTTNFVGAQKSDNDGGDSKTILTTNITADNSSSSKNVLINVVKGLSGSDAELQGGSLNDKGVVVTSTAGNIAVASNTLASTNTIDIKSGTNSTARIVGDVYTHNGKNNIRLIDSGTVTPSTTSGLVGNIITKGGSTNIVLENTLFSPANLASLPSLGSSPEAMALKAYIAEYGTGSVTTNGGTTTVVSRLNQSSMLSGTPLLFKVNNQSGETNLVMQIDNGVELHTEAQISYGNGVVNAIFANSNNGLQGTVVGGMQTADSGNAQSETFEGAHTDSSLNKFMGLTYQDGVKLKLQSQTVYFGNEAVDLISRYGDQFRALNTNGNLLTIESDRNNAQHSDTITLTGLIVGEISSLNSTTAGSNKLYVNTLVKNSAFVGNIALDDATANATLDMQANTKLVLTGDKAVIKTLTLQDQNTFDHNQLVLETLSQTNNRVINLATNGGSASAVDSRDNFRLLEIGSTTSADIQSKTGLIGTEDQTLVLMTYINTNASQKTVVNNDQDQITTSGATLGGEAAFVEVASASRTITNQSAGLGKYGYSYADRIIIHNVSTASGQTLTQTAKDAGSVYMQFAVDADTNLGGVRYSDALGVNGKGGTAVEGNVAVLTVANAIKSGTASTDTADALIKLDTQDTLQGFDVIHGSLTAVATDANGMVDSITTNNTYTTYFVDSLVTRGSDSAIQDVVSSAFATSLDIYMANFNSLNKRMGELRDNDNSQGAWARVFGGQQSSSFGVGSTTGYATVQAGYDYAFGFEGANNYLGLAVAYGFSSSSTSNATNTLNGVSEGVEGDLKSKMVEVALYNSYVQDSGWYNDTIFKFNYIMNDFSMTGTASGNTVSTNNFGIILSDEFGYRFKLGENNEWYIDPQAEFSFGYVNGSEYTLTSGRSTLQAQSDAMMTLRSRFGSSFGYDFKQFTEGKDIKASVYVGAFYEYDYMNGGDITLTTNLGGVNSIQSSLASDGRVVMNLGTNMTVKDNTRIYFDFESSFAGKITTDYQVNVGVRYSFGENTSYVPASGMKKEVAPLKVSDENNAEEKVEESKEAENADAQAQESETQEKTTESNTEEKKAQ